MSLEGNIEKDVETERKVHEGYTSEDESNPSLDKYSPRVLAHLS